LLADALASLHARGDAEGALALLAEHRRRFPHGALRSEARVAEVEALLSLERRSDALRVLDGLVIERVPRGAEIGVLRGELRAQAGRCADAIADFDRCAAGRSCGADAEERALFGRASCRGKLGQTAAARADLERYLLRFPRGWRSESVRRALAERR
jgi:tetratricopeptide (TPR) repeat protein